MYLISCAACLISGSVCVRLCDILDGFDLDPCYLSSQGLRLESVSTHVLSLPVIQKHIPWLSPNFPPSTLPSVSHPIQINWMGSNRPNIRDATYMWLSAVLYLAEIDNICVWGSIHSRVSYSTICYSDFISNDNQWRIGKLLVLTTVGLTAMIHNSLNWAEQTEQGLSYTHWYDCESLLIIYVYLW